MLGFGGGVAIVDRLSWLGVMRGGRLDCFVVTVTAMGAGFARVPLLVAESVAVPADEAVNWNVTDAEPANDTVGGVTWPVTPATPSVTLTPEALPLGVSVYVCATPERIDVGPVSVYVVAD